jgi:ankyrin repeat protein
MNTGLQLFGAIVCSVQLLSAQGTQAAAPATAEDFFRLIRGNDLDAVRQLAAKSGAAGVRTRLGETPLHYAATYGTTESVRILLDRGADPNARNNAEATPLIYAGYSLEKTRLLVEKGADVNAHARNGVTPLMVAASVHGNVATVRYLLEKGADAKATRASGGDALQTAALKSEVEAVRLLLAKGADAHRADNAGSTALMSAFLNVADREMVRLLLDAGADVNAFNTDAGRRPVGPVTTFRLTPLLYAAPAADPGTIAMLLKAGAGVNAADYRKMTALMLAVATDRPNTETVRQLIAAGADVNAKDQNGDSVLDWALKFRHPEILAALRKAGAKAKEPVPAPVRPASFAAGGPADAIARAMPLLAKSGDVFFTAGGGCVGCHHQALNARAYGSLRAAGLKPDERFRRTFLDGMLAERAGLLTDSPFMLAIGGDTDTLFYEIVSLGDMGEPAGPSTDAIVHYLAARQTPSGAWGRSAGPRTPMESSTISRTAWSMRALKTYAWPARRPEFDERIARGRAWLLAARPATSYEEADRIMGLRLAGASDADLTAAVRTLVSEQREDGGWPQNPYLDSDAYATGVVLSTLSEAGLLKPADAAYSRGVAYLLRTQFPDGSWYVRSRSPKLQPYFQSAFPYEHDQWISAAATARAVMALAPAAAPQTRATR